MSFTILRNITNPKLTIITRTNGSNFLTDVTRPGFLGGAGNFIATAGFVNVNGNDNKVRALQTIPQGPESPPPVRSEFIDLIGTNDNKVSGNRVTIVGGDSNTVQGNNLTLINCTGQLVSENDLVMVNNRRQDPKSCLVVSESTTLTVTYRVWVVSGAVANVTINLPDPIVEGFPWQIKSTSGMGALKVFIDPGTVNLDGSTAQVTINKKDAIEIIGCDGQYQVLNQLKS